MPKSSAIVILVAILYTFILPGVQIAAIFDPRRMRILDRYGTSVLIRGNAPINEKGDLDPDMVLQSISEMIARTWVARNEKMSFDRLVVVSLLSSSQSDEMVILQKQLTYSKDELHKNPCSDRKKHKFCHRPTVGSWIIPRPTKYMTERLKQSIWSYLKPDDGSWDLAGELRAMLLDYEKTAVYVHCMRGMDRTGLVAGTYLARWKNATEDAVLQSNYEVAGRELNWPAQNSLQWVNWKASSHLENEP